MSQTNNIVELNLDEQHDIDGGYWPLIAAGSIALAGFAVGVYNGYQSQKEASKK